MESLKIIRADLSHIQLAVEALQNVHGRKNVSTSTTRAFLERSENVLLLACQGDQVIGSLNGYSLIHPDRSSPQFLLYEIDVLPSFQNKGVGQTLVGAFIDLARQYQAFEVWVLTNASNGSAMKMYQKCGFKRKNQDDVMLNMMLE